MVALSHDPDKPLTASALESLNISVSAVWDPQKPLEKVESVRLSIRRAARARELEQYCDENFTRPTAASHESFKLLSPETSKVPLKDVQTSFDEGSKNFYKIVSKHIKCSTESIARQVVRDFDSTQDGVGMYKWFLTKSSRSTAGRPWFSVSN